MENKLTLHTVSGDYEVNDNSILVIIDTKIYESEVKNTSIH